MTTSDVIARLHEELAKIDLGYTERFERNAERFYEATGFLAPGKSVPLEMASAYQDDKREVAWTTWNLQQKENYRQLLTEAASSSCLRSA